MFDFLGIIGLISGLISIIVFLTGKPSIYHFLPLKDITIISFIDPINIKWKFIVIDNQLYLRSNDIEIPLAINTKKYKDYKILQSKDNKKYVIISKKNETLFILDSDGKNRKIHNFHNFIDVKWVDSQSFIIALQGSPFSNEVHSKSVFIKEEELIRDASGIFLVRINNDNSISTIKPY